MLFDTREYYQQFYENEINIIQMIKTDLLTEYNYIDNINDILKDFYNSIGINIDLSIFENIPIVITPNISNNINEIPYNNYSYCNDVICTLDESEKNKLNKYILKKNTESNCNICLDEMKKNQKVIKLPCNHLYHYKCINKYLEKYNYKCPCCRIEVGKPKYNI